RAWAVRKVLVAPDLATARRMILVPANHPGDVVVLERRPSIGPFHPGPRPDVRITHLDPQRIAIDADADGNAMLVLAQQYYPDWIAYRDGQPVPTFRANVLAMAFELPPGRHHFEIVYRPWSFSLGAAISLLTLASGLFYLARPRIHGGGQR
ncbi:MAG TPA: YfhO family protein, partial [Chloroflexota bacterium]|nr:YfhO family protein [Chloroflexota bacterium]